MDAIVITSCTGRKRAVAPALLQALPAAATAERHTAGVHRLASAWAAALERAATRCLITDLYAGRAFADARAVARTLGASLSVASTGLGLVASHEAVPAYDLTVAAGVGSIQPHLQQMGASVAQWWQAINQARHGCAYPLARLLGQRRFDRVLIALPARYVEMVADDLARVPEVQRGPVRIFTSPAGRQALPPAWQAYVMPYDARLDGPASPRRGTQTDFAQRAMRHFAEDLQAATLLLHQAHTAVDNALARMGMSAVPHRRRVTDDEVLALLATHWAACRGQSSRLLRLLRDDAQVACEQSRFRALWLQARATMAARAEAPA